MKKFLLIVAVFFLTLSCAQAAKVGDYIELWKNINTLKQSTHPQAKEIIKNLEMMLTTNDQTMAETITLMLATAEQQSKQIICLPKKFQLNNDTIIQLIMDGFNHSTLAIEQKKELPAALFVIEELHRQYPCLKPAQPEVA